MSIQISSLATKNHNFVFENWESYHLYAYNHLITMTLSAVRFTLPRFFSKCLLVTQKIVFCLQKWNIPLQEFTQILKVKWLLPIACIKTKNTYPLNVSLWWTDSSILSWQIAKAWQFGIQGLMDTCKCIPGTPAQDNSKHFWHTSWLKWFTWKYFHMIKSHTPLFPAKKNCPNF